MREVTTEEALDLLRSAVRREAIEAAAQALGEGTGSKTRTYSKRNGAGQKTGAGDKVVAFVKAHPGCKGVEIAEGTGLKQKQATGALVKARHAGVLRVKGKTRGARWFAK